MEQKQFKLYGYRWVVLSVVMFINLTIQILWISYAPITTQAASYYGVSELYIGFFAMSFMAAFIPLSIPVSWMLDSIGFKPAVSIGVILMGVFGVLRGLAGANYTLAMLCTVGLAIAQPFLLNAWTIVAAKWFAIEERATAVGLITVANLIGTAIGMVVTPIMLSAGVTIAQTQLLFGVIAAVSSALFLLLAKEKPASPPCPPGQDARALMVDGLKHALTVGPFWLYLAVIFVGLGIFNGLTTWIQVIIGPRGFSSEDAGIVGAVFLISGIFGAGILPIFSDRQHKRRRYLLLGVIGAIPGMIGLTFADNYWLLLISAFVMGFFLVSVSPIGMQYSAEVTYPTPEGTSNGLIQLAGQASVVFVYIMQWLSGFFNNSFTPAMLMSTVLLIVCLFLVSFMKDPSEYALSHKQERSMSQA